MQEQPKVSVIIPVYNTEKYLRQCLDSVVNQTLKDIEIICVDDGSTDASLQILREYEARDRRVKVLTQKNQFAGVARNNGMKVAHGEYIAFLDADDWLELNAYEILFHTMQTCEAEVCVCRHRKYDNTQNTTEDRAYYSLEKASFSTDWRYLCNIGVVPWNKLYNRKFLIDNHITFQNIICANDRSFYFKVVKAAKEIVFIQDILINYRVNNSCSLVGETRLKHFDCHFRAFESIWQLMSDQPKCVKEMILQITLADIANFYMKAQGERKKEIAQQIKEYLQTMPMHLLKDDIENKGWYYTLFDVLPDELTHCSGILSKARKKMRKLCRCWKEHGAVYTVQVILYHFHLGKAPSLSSCGKKPLLLRFMNCWKEHGFHYTLKRVYAHLHFPCKRGCSAKKHTPELIVSLTTYPARIEKVHITINTILRQTVRPDRILLWLAEEQFPNKDADLPAKLLALCKFGLEIRWCHDIRSYKKLIPTLALYPEAVIVTADDDAYYDKDWLEKLYESYLKWPDFIHCHRDTAFYLENGEFKYISAGKKVYPCPTYLHKLTGLGGVLYPPHSLYQDVLKEELFMKLAKTNDDQWFWFMAIMNHTRIIVVHGCNPTPKIVEGTQETGLTKINDHGPKLFDQDFQRLLKYYPEAERLLREDWEFVTEYERCAAVRIKDYDYYSFLPAKAYAANLTEWYFSVSGQWLDLDKPKTFNEKIQWMKLYDSTPLKTRLADKYLVRDWVKEKIGEEYLIPLLGVWDSFDEIDFDKLPNQFALKANHGSGWNIIVKDKAQFNRAEAKEKFDKWVRTNFAFKNGFELHYMNIPPKIIAEKYLENADGLIDYRFYCFNGKPEQVWVDIYSGTPQHLRSVFDMQWNKLSLKCTWPDGGELLRKKPKNFKKMKEIAALLSKDFPFVRVDFFEVDEKLFMGEMTFTPMTGTGKFEPKEWDRKLGDLLTLPPKSPIPERLF